MRTQPGGQRLDAPQSEDPAAQPGKEPAQPGAVGVAAAPQRPSRLRLRNWRVPVRLVAMIVIPTVVAVVLGGLRLSAASSEADTYTRVQRLAELGTEVASLAHEFGNERDLSAGYVAAGRPVALKGRVDTQYAKTDAVAGRVRMLAAEVGGAYEGASADARSIISRLDGITPLRTLTTSQVPVATLILKYSEPANAFIAFLDGIAQGSADEDLARTTRALAALARTKEQASRQRAVLYAAALVGRLDSTGLESLIASRAQFDSELATFRTAASLSQRQFFDDTVTGRQVDEANEYEERGVSTRTFTGRIDLDPRTRQDARLWYEAMTGTIDKMRVVEQRLVGQVSADAGAAKSDAQLAALLQGALVAIVLVLVLLATFIVARSLVRPLRRLRHGALEIAGSRLPGLVERLRDPQAAMSGIEVEPIDIDSTDEIGEVARAFDEVHREAVRLAADEAVLRGNVNSMFVNLSRRSQSLIERQLRLIDELEQGEQDEERLGSLFRLDHLATRMRRNCENLLVLGGQDQVRRWNHPVPLIDIVRASLSEVEQYDRIGLRVQGEVSVVGTVVNDLVHLVAELVENATVFSPEHTKVTVSGHLLSGGGAMLQISDNGVGMSPEELEAANWRLATPPVIDFSAARRMGLFVVGRLAVRHSIRVELRSALSGGLTAFVLLPGALIAGNEGQGDGPRRLGGEPAAVEPAAVPAGVAPAIGAGAVGAVGTASLAPPEEYAPQLGFGPGTNAQGLPRRTPGAQKPGTPVPMEPIAEAPAIASPGTTGPIIQTGGQPVAPYPAQDGHPGAERYPEYQGQDSGPWQQADYAHPPVRPSQGPGWQQPPADRPGPAHESAGGMHQQPQPRPVQPRPPVRPRSRLPGFSDTAQNGGAAGRSPWGTGEQVMPGRPTTVTPPERSPIFDAMESEWFQRRTVRPQNGPSEETAVAWQSPGDEGWQAAEVVREPTSGGQTSAGLPKRVPGKNRVPGGVTPPTSTSPPEGAAPAQPQQPATSQSAEVVRNRFASLQQGRHRGRAEAHNTDDETRK